MSLSNTTVTASVAGGETNTFGAVSVAGNVNHTSASNGTPLTNGSGSGAAQIIVSFTATVGTGGTTYDLTALAGGLNGAARNFSAVKALLIENLDLAVSITVAAGAANGWTGINGAVSGSPITVEIGGHFQRYNPVAGIATISGSAKTILISSASSTAAIKVTVVGVGS